MAEPKAVAAARTLMALRARNEIIAAGTSDERAAIVARVRRIDSDLADELEAMAAKLPERVKPANEPTADTP